MSKEMSNAPFTLAPETKQQETISDGQQCLQQLTC